MKRLLPLLAMLLLSGCAGFQLVPAGKVEFRDQIAIETPDKKI